MYYLQAEDTAFVDEINKREEEKVWKARDDALKAREDARQYLMQAVDEGRKQQIASKREMSEKEREEGQLFARKFLDEASEAVQRYCQLQKGFCFLFVVIINYIWVCDTERKRLL